MLQLMLLLAAALFAVGLYGLLSQQSIVMIMMGAELALNGLIVAAAGVWAFLVPSADPLTLILIVITAMAVEMVMGFAVATNLFRVHDVDMTEGAGELKG